MADKELRSSASFPESKLSDEQRKLIGSAIVGGLITPGSFTFNNPLATEGGDYNQNGGGYNQGGGGNHNQGGGGDYNQHALLANFGEQEVTNLVDVLRGIERLRR
jgi:hypothetical protein